MYKIKLYLKNPLSVLKKLAYFAIHPIIFIKNRQAIYKLASSEEINTGAEVRSNLPIDIIFPTIEKDFEVVRPMIDSVRKYVRHPIENIYIISPPSEEIKSLCTEKKCIFVDENFLLPITIKDVKYYHRGVNRSGWLFQQLLKWGAVNLGTTSHFLITESDTVFIRPRIFEYAEKYIIPCNSELPHIPYFSTYRKLLGEKIEPVLNLTSHHGLYDKKILQELKNNIEKQCGTNWYQAILNNIDESEGSFVSDYETYLQYLFKHYPDKSVLEHWGNISLPRKEIKNLEILEEQLKRNYKVISFHSYNK